MGHERNARLHDRFDPAGVTRASLQLDRFRSSRDQSRAVATACSGVSYV